MRGLRPRTFPAKRRPHPRSESEAFAEEALACAVCRYEEAAVRTLEAAMAFGLAGDQFGRERLLAMGADDLVRRFLGGDLGHVATLPAFRDYGRNRR